MRVINALAADKEYYGLGYWANPHRSGEKEYYLVGPFADRKGAKASLDRRAKGGQPESFTNWVNGKSTIAEAAGVPALLQKNKLVVPKLTRTVDNPGFYRLQEK